jgi:hypothetical protein
MSGRKRTSAPLVVGIAISIALHLGVLVPALVASMTAQTEAAPQLESDFDAESLAPPEMEHELELGEPDSQQSTLVWLGYDEYQEHLAALSEVEQAAFDERPWGAMPTNPAPPSPEVPQQPTEERQPDAPMELAMAEEPTAREQPVDQPSETEIELERDTASVEPTVVAELDAPDAQPTPLPADQPVAPEEPAGVNAAPHAAGEGPMLEAISQFLEQMLSTAQQVAEEMAASRAAGRDEEHAAPDEAHASASDSKPASSAKESENAETEQSKQTPRVTASAPAPATEKPGEQREADQSDQESDASSRTEVTMEDLKIGKPLVAHGLELKPRKPTFTNLIRMTALPGNPLCEIRFQSNGKPALARLLSTSGDSRVDDAVLASLYRWRASGPPLEELKDGGTVNIQIRIIFNAR